MSAFQLNDHCENAVTHDCEKKKNRSNKQYFDLFSTYKHRQNRTTAIHEKKRKITIFKRKYLFGYSMKKKL